MYFLIDLSTRIFIILDFEQEISAGFLVSTMPNKHIHIFDIKIFTFNDFTYLLFKFSSINTLVKISKITLTLSILTTSNSSRAVRTGIFSLLWGPPVDSTSPGP